MFLQEQDTSPWHLILTASLQNAGILIWREPRQSGMTLLRWGDSSHLMSPRVLIQRFRRRRPKRARLSLAKQIMSTLKASTTGPRCFQSVICFGCSVGCFQKHIDCKIIDVLKPGVYMETSILPNVGMIPSICIACFFSVHKLGEMASLLYSGRNQGKNNLVIRFNRAPSLSKLATVEAY